MPRYIGNLNECTDPADADNLWIEDASAPSSDRDRRVSVSRFARPTPGTIMLQPDGVTWTARTSAADNGWLSVCYGNGLFVAVAYTGTGNRVMTSPNGVTWTARTSAADNQWYSVCYGNGLFVAVANTGTGNRVMTCGKQIEHFTQIG